MAWSWYKRVGKKGIGLADVREQIDCPHCKGVLEYSSKRPTYCSHCGKPLVVSPLASTIQVPPAELGVLETQDDIPTKVGNYRLLRTLGIGGMGSVHEAQEEGSGRRFAVKLIASRHASSAESLERFRQEGRLASLIAHPRCVFVVAADEERGRPYIVMELMPGRTLKELVDEEGPLEPKDAVVKVLDVIEGLSEAHHLGVIHRDVKPSNCFLDDSGRVKIGDFGLSKSLIEGTQITQTGVFVGTPLFAAPEQIRREPVGVRTDVYSVAATLYFLLTGQAPFQQEDALAAMARIVADPPPSMRTIRPEISPALDQVVLRGLERHPDRRYSDLAEFRAALLPFAQPRATIGTVGLRIGAWAIDYLLYVPLSFLLSVDLWRSFQMTYFEPTALKVLSLAAGNLLWFTYLVFFEGMWGASIGKRVLGLRVAGTHGDIPAEWPRVFFRTLIFSVCWLPIQLFVDFFEPAPDEIGLYAVMALFALPGTLLVIGSTMRRTNGYRGIHEIVSGTRVVLLPAVVRHRGYRSFVEAQAQASLAPSPGIPKELGMLSIHGALRWGEGEKLLLAQDRSLGREAWVRIHDGENATYEAARREVNRPTRPRWLAGGEVNGERWDAYVAPGGCPLSALVTDTRALAWHQLRPILEQLTDELVTAASDGTFPHRLSIEQVWIQPSGRVQLLEPAAEVMKSPEGESLDERALRFLFDVAVLSLRGPTAQARYAARRRGGDKALPNPFRIPLPLHAAQILERLAQDKQPYESLDQLWSDLLATQYHPPAVTRSVRSGQLAVHALFTLVGLGLMFLFTRFFGVTLIGAIAENAERLTVAKRVLDDPSLRHQYLLMVNARQGNLEQLRTKLREQLHADREEIGVRRRNLDWLTRWAARSSGWRLDLPRRIVAMELVNPASMEVKVTWYDERLLATETQEYGVEAYALSESDIATVSKVARLENLFGVLAVIWFFPALWFVFAFIFRGGLSFLLLGLCLVRSNGRLAFRIQCAWRALLVWGPVAGLLTLSAFLEYVAAGHHLLSLLCWWAALALVLVGLLASVWFPSRSPQDRLARTYLVPR
ncbi:MAG: protein kinase [Planctomycetota bacterium]